MGLMNDIVLSRHVRQFRSRTGNRGACRRRGHAGSRMFDKCCRARRGNGMRRVETAHRLAILWNRVSRECKLERIEGIFARPASQELSRIAQRACRFGRRRGCWIRPSRIGAGRVRLRRAGNWLIGLRLRRSGNLIATSRAQRAFVIGRGNSRHVGLTFLAPHPCGSGRKRKPTGEKETQPARRGIIATLRIDARPVLPLVSRLRIVHGQFSGMRDSAGNAQIPD